MASVLFIITVPRESVFVFQGSFVKVKAIFMPLEFPCYFELHRIQCFFFTVQWHEFMHSCFFLRENYSFPTWQNILALDRIILSLLFHFV